MSREHDKRDDHQHQKDVLFLHLFLYAPLARALKTQFPTKPLTGGTAVPGMAPRARVAGARYDSADPGASASR